MNGSFVGEVCSGIDGGGAAYTVQRLINSPAHYNIMMDTYATNKTMAVATYYANGWWYTCVNFIY